ncbi:peptidase S8/S53 domain-containing protein [Aspergillus unguis]
MRSLLLLACALPALCFPAIGPHVLHERRDAYTSGTKVVTRLAGDKVLPVRIRLTQSNLDKGHDLLMQVSDPFSATYGQHLSTEQVHDLFAPAEESVTKVRAWLEAEGIEEYRISQSKDKQSLRFDATASELERLLRAEYYLYEDEEAGTAHVSAQEYHLPVSIQPHVDFVQPGIGQLKAVRRSAPRSRQQLHRRQLNDTIIGTDVLLSDLLKDPISFCDRVITPGCIKIMYNISDGTTATPGNELGIYAVDPDGYAQGDLDLSFATAATEIPHGTHPTIYSINGGTAPLPLETSGFESALDLQVSYPLIWPQNSIVYQIGADEITPDDPDGTNRANDYLFAAIDGSYCDGADDLSPEQCDLYNPPNVLSISYGAAETSLPMRQSQRECHEWMKLGLQGVSVVIASGDYGVIVDSCNGPNRTIFDPDFPATCPYVTVTGMTKLPVGGDPYNPHEVAAYAPDPDSPREFSSGGGFSNIFERPAYQDDAVEGYFSRAKLDLPFYETVNNESMGAGGGVYNRIGRAYPDISLTGDGYLIYVRGMAGIGGGTSASAPLFGAMLTRINEVRLAAGMPTVGFANPVLYAHPEVFRDVTEGYNEGCGGERGTVGFSAIEGWDPVTGLGTPVFDRLLEVFMCRH